MNRSIALAATLASLVLWTPDSRAEVFVEIFNADVVASPGTGLDLEGAIENTGLETIYLNGLSSDASEEYAPDDAFAPFFTSAPASLGPLERWEGILMRVELAPSAPTDIAILSLSVHGGAHAYSGDPLSTAYFVINDPNTIAGVDPSPDPPPHPVLTAAPNPFIGSTNLRLVLVHGGAVEAAIFDPQGRTVRRLLDAPLTAGRHEVTWDGLDDSGLVAPGGIYFVRVRSASLGLNLKSKIIFLGR